MNERIFELLINYGFSKSDLSCAEEKNPNLYYIDLNTINRNLLFFEKKGLNKRELINLIKDNWYLLTDDDINNFYLIDDILL